MRTTRSKSKSIACEKAEGEPAGSKLDEESVEGHHGEKGIAIDAQSNG